ncbi:MAG TPA: hypothetical protein VN805_08465 [Caulobacteraceae bacterium]|nr:hypothetical protein [Caulobacteraceae bacterium]
MLKSITLAAVLALAAAPALAQVGNPAMPIEIKMKRGTDRATVRGVLVQNGACCTYVFRARAGQKLYWSEDGAVVRMVLTNPDGEAEGPGLYNPQPLPQSGVYTLAISPDLMAEGAFGPYVLKLRIPPK